MMSSLSMFLRDMIRFIDAARIDPTVFQPVCPRPIGTEPQFCTPSLVRPRALLDIVKGNLVVVGPPGVGEDGVGIGRCSHVLCQGQLTMDVDL